MFSEEDAQPDFVSLEAFGKGERPTHQARNALAQRAEKSLGMAGLSLGLRAESVRARWNNTGSIGKPQVAARGATEITWRQRSAQPAGTLFRAVAEHGSNDLAGSAAQERSRASTRLPSCCQ
jgi:hypothetical protein